MKTSEELQRFAEGMTRKLESATTPLERAILGHALKGLKNLEKKPRKLASLLALTSIDEEDREIDAQIAAANARLRELQSEASVYFVSEGDQKRRRTKE